MNEVQIRCICLDVHIIFLMYYNIRSFFKELSNSIIQYHYIYAVLMSWNRQEYVNCIVLQVKSALYQIISAYITGTFCSYIMSLRHSFLIRRLIGLFLSSKETFWSRNINIVYDSRRYNWLSFSYIAMYLNGLVTQYLTLTLLNIFLIFTYRLNLFVEWSYLLMMITSCHEISEVNQQLTFTTWSKRQGRINYRSLGSIHTFSF